MSSGLKSWFARSMREAAARIGAAVKQSAREQKWRGIERLDDRLMLSGDVHYAALDSTVTTETLTVSVGQELIYTEADNTAVTIELTGKGGQMIVEVEVTDSGTYSIDETVKSITITNADGSAAVTSITLTGTTTKEQLKIKGKAGDAVMTTTTDDDGNETSTTTDSNDQVSIDTISGSGFGLKAIKAKTTDVATVALNYDEAVSKIQLEQLTSSMVLSGASDNGISLDFTQLNDASITSGTDIKSLEVDQWQNSGSLDAPYVKKLEVSGDLAADITLTGVVDEYAMKKLTVGGTFSGSLESSIGSIKKVSLQAVLGVQFYVGVSSAVTDGLPVFSSDFDQQLSIDSIKISANFQDSTFAAYTLETVKLTGLVNTDNDGTTFGFASTYVNNYKRENGDTKVKVKKNETAGNYDVADDYLALITINNS